MRAGGGGVRVRVMVAVVVVVEVVVGPSKKYPLISGVLDIDLAAAAAAAAAPTVVDPNGGSRPRARRDAARAFLPPFSLLPPCFTASRTTEPVSAESSPPPLLALLVALAAVGDPVRLITSLAWGRGGGVLCPRPDGNAAAAGRFDEEAGGCWGDFAPPRLPLTSASLRDEFSIELGDTTAVTATVEEGGEELVEVAFAASGRRLTVPGGGDGVAADVEGVPKNEALPELKGLLGLRAEGAGEDEKKLLMSERV